MAACLRLGTTPASCITSTLYSLCCRDRDAGPKFSNLSFPIPSQPLLQMVQHVADWVVSTTLFLPQIFPYSFFSSHPLLSSILLLQFSSSPLFHIPASILLPSNSSIFLLQFSSSPLFHIPASILLPSNSSIPLLQFSSFRPILQTT